MGSSSIREARVEDIPVIVDMVRAGSAEGVFRSRNFSLKEQIEDFRKHAFENRPAGQQILIYRVGSTILGYVDYRVRWGLGQVLGIYVKPSHRRRGIGKKLMGRTLDDFKKEGCHKARLSVLANNQGAINFYKHFGFVQEGYLRQDAEKKDTIIMSKFLT
jgi:ribosomal protein S18 acetylase RimI-like enzyme